MLAFALACAIVPQLFAQVNAPAAPKAESPADALAPLLADLIRDALPRDYAKQENWGGQKNITSGIKFDGLRMSRRHKEVDHGTWKQYRVVIDEGVDESPASLSVRIDNLRSLESGQIGLTLVTSATLKGWAQMRRYNRGIHIITLTAEGDSQLVATIDCEIALRTTISGMAVVPTVKHARVDIAEFNLTKFGEIRGEPAEQLGRGMKHIMQHELDGDKLTNKLNAAIAKKQDRLVIDFASAMSLQRSSINSRDASSRPQNSPAGAPSR